MPFVVCIIILGIIEGITEFLPISSTGHLLITENWMVKKNWMAHPTDLFNVVIQSGAVLAVIPLFRERFHQFIYRWRERATQDYFIKLMTAFVITGIGGFILEKKKFKLPEELGPVAWALLIGGVAFVIVESLVKNKKSNTEITWTIALAVGIGQLIAAAFPGASRSGTTILFCLILGLARPAATEFSFLVGIPTMLTAGGYKIFKELRHHEVGAPAENWSMVLLATVIAAIVSFFAVKWLLHYVRSHTFIAFGWYRIVLAGLIFWYIRTM